MCIYIFCLVSNDSWDRSPIVLFVCCLSSILKTAPLTEITQMNADLTTGLSWSRGSFNIITAACFRVFAGQLTEEEINSLQVSCQRFRTRLLRQTWQWAEHVKWRSWLLKCWPRVGLEPYVFPPTSITHCSMWSTATWQTHICLQVIAHDGKPDVL